MTDPESLDHPFYRRVQAGALVVAPLIQLAANPAAFINPGANVSIDAWVYTGFFLSLPRHLQQFGSTYYSTRLSWLLPGFVTHRLLPPLAANYALHLLLFYALIWITYRFLASGAGRHQAMLGAQLVAWSPAILEAIGSDYVDGAGIVYLMAALLCLEFAAAGPHDRAWSIAAGAAAACLVITNLALVLLLPACGVFVLLRVGASRWRWVVRSTVASFAGVVATLAMFAAANRSLGGHWLFLEPSIRFAWTMSVAANPWRDATFQWSWAVWLAVPAVAAIGTILSVATSPPRTGTFARGVQWTFLTICAIWVTLDAVTHTALLRFPYYVSYLAPLALISIALQAGDRTAPRGWRSALTLELTVYAALALAHVGFLKYGAGFWTAAADVAPTLGRLGVMTLVITAVGSVALVLLRFLPRSAIGGVTIAAGLAFVCAAPHLWQGAGEPDARARFQAVTAAHRFIAAHLDGSARFWYRFPPGDAPPLRAIASTYLWGWVLVNEEMPHLTGEQAATLRSDTRLVLLVKGVEDLETARTALKQFGWDYSIVTRERFGVDRQACTVVIADLMRAPQGT